MFDPAVEPQYLQTQILHKSEQDETQDLTKDNNTISGALELKKKEKTKKWVKLLKRKIGENTLLYQR